VLARELNLKQIKKISKIIDVECFVHGAMCVSVSGRCFTSQFLCNKSANRGECQQFCRREYIVIDDEGRELKLVNNKVMSAKDLCSLPFMDKLKKAGVKSFKIEGRNKPAEYVRTVVSVYRCAIDKNLSDGEIQEGLEELKKVYNRDFSTGFYLGVPTNEDFSRTENGEAKERKKILGRILTYLPKVGVAVVKLQAADLSVGDEIYITGIKTGLVRIKVERMEIDHKPIEKAKQGLIVGIKTPKCNKGDEVYLIEQKYADKK
jgi:U32 family peptidase